MKFNYCILLLVIVTMLFGCGNPMGDRVDSKNLNVYYINGVSKKQAIAFAKYWRDNGFIGDKFQTIQLEKLVSGTININLIEDKFYEKKLLSIEEKAFLSKLTVDLRKEVFDGNGIEIVITDNTFKPLER